MRAAQENIQRSKALRQIVKCHHQNKEAAAFSNKFGKLKKGSYRK